MKKQATLFPVAQTPVLDELDLSEAQRMAQQIQTTVAPYCEAIQVAGSVRRQRSRKYRDFGSVMVLLGHKNRRYVLLYVQLSKNYEHGGDGYICREARTLAEEKALIEDGFEYVKDRGGVSLYRKVK